MKNQRDYRSIDGVDQHLKINEKFVEEEKFIDLLFKPFWLLYKAEADGW